MVSRLGRYLRYPRTDYFHTLAISTSISTGTLPRLTSDRSTTTSNVSTGFKNICWLHTPDFLETFDTYFANFVPTLRSLHLDTPMGDTRDILDFICRFPHLDDLTLEMPSGDPFGWGSAPSPIVKKMPPFRGRLKLTNIDNRHGHLLQQLTSLPGKRRFRFMDFRSCTSDVEQPIIDACSGTLETISVTLDEFCKYWFIL